MQHVLRADNVRFLPGFQHQPLQLSLILLVFDLQKGKQECDALAKGLNHALFGKLGPDGIFALAERAA